MKRWLLLALILLFLSGCSFSNFWKWMDQMDWERDDQTVKIIHFLLE